MKKRFFAAFLISLMLLASGCGSNTPPVVVASIASSAAYDADILNGTTVSPPNTASVFAGIDPVSLSEYRAFLLFPLVGAVPGNAFIDSATLEIFIDSITLHPLASSIPIRIELISYTPPVIPSDYYRANLSPLAYTTIIPPISSADRLRFVRIDVTGLMIEAQIRGLSNFQIRILEDDGFVYPGLIEINETNAKAPLLVVAYH